MNIRSIFNKHFGIEEERQVDTTPRGFDKIEGYEDIKKIVRSAIFDSKRHEILFVGPPACAKTLFLEAVIEQAGQGLYFDGTNTTNKILDVLEQQRPNIVCIDELEKMPKNFQEKLLNLCDSGRVDVEQKKTQYHFTLEKLKIFGAANDKTRLSKPLRSRFLVLNLPKPTEQQFIEIAKKLTPCLGKTAGFIAKCVYAQGGDIRSYRQIADFVEMGWSEQDVLELMETMNKYSEKAKEEIGMHRVVDMIKIVRIALFTLVLALVGSTSATIGMARAQLWYNTQADSAIECSDDEPGNPSPGPDMLGCPYDFMKHVAGFPELVGSWHIINQTSNGSIDRNLTGIMTFNHNGTMQFVLPMTVVYDSGGDKSNTVNGSWGVNGYAHWLDVCFEGNQCAKLTFIEKSHDHMELRDDNGDTIHLTRVSNQ